MMQIIAEETELQIDEERREKLRRTVVEAAVRVLVELPLRPGHALFLTSWNTAEGAGLIATQLVAEAELDLKRWGLLNVEVPTVPSGQTLIVYVLSLNGRMLRGVALIDAPKPAPTESFN